MYKRQDGKLVEKREVKLPEKIVNVLHCKNPRCITSIEQELDDVFILTDKKNGLYSCQYCEEQQGKLWENIKKMCIRDSATDISDLQNIIKEQSMLQKIHITLS